MASVLLGQKIWLTVIFNYHDMIDRDIQQLPCRPYRWNTTCVYLGHSRSNIYLLGNVIRSNGKNANNEGCRYNRSLHPHAHRSNIRSILLDRLCGRQATTCQRKPPSYIEIVCTCCCQCCTNWGAHTFVRQRTFANILIRYDHTIWHDSSQTHHLFSSWETSRRDWSLKR